MKTVLVTGGAGYIGSHTVKMLTENGYRVVVVDNLSNGHAEAVKNVPLKRADLRDEAALKAVFDETPFDAVVHFAALSLVGQSVTEPDAYYDNNVAGTLRLLNQMRAHGVTKIVFSGSCAVYGVPERLPLTEDHPRRPVSPYGETKMMAEDIFADYARAYGLSYTALRYFNAAGADESGNIGESHAPETHLIPLVLQTIAGKRPRLTVYGDDYDTHDGTGVRDYIHVVDLAKGHVSACDFAASHTGCETINLGTGTGYSVLDLVKTFSRVNGIDLPYQIDARRPGDIDRCFADPEKAKRLLGWQAEKNLEDMCRDAWNFQKNNPHGYA